MHEDLLVYYRKHEQHLEHFLALCIEETEPENIHQLRVSIKHLRAVLHFTGQISGTENHIAENQLKSLRKLFKIAGHLRDVQVQQKLLPEYEALINVRFDHYKTFLDKLEKQFIKKFNSFIEKAKPIHRLSAGQEIIERALEILTPEEIRKGVEQLLASRCSNIRQIMGEKPDDKKLHEIRIIIKQMRYILSIMRKNNPESLEKIVSLNDLTDPEILLGRWHDIVVGISFLNDFRESANFRKVSSVTDYSLLAKMQDSERNKLRKKIIRALGKSFCT